MKASYVAVNIYRSSSHPTLEASTYILIYNIILLYLAAPLMCVLNSTRKRTNRLQYSVCKCEVESTGKWSNIGVLFNQPHFNLVPKFEN